MPLSDKWLSRYVQALVVLYMPAPCFQISACWRGRVGTDTAEFSKLPGESADSSRCSTLRCNVSLSVSHAVTVCRWRASQTARRIWRWRRMTRSPSRRSRTATAMSMARRRMPSDARRFAVCLLSWLDPLRLHRHPGLLAFHRSIALPAPSSCMVCVPVVGLHVLPEPPVCLTHRQACCTLQGCCTPVAQRGGGWTLASGGCASSRTPTGSSSAPCPPP